MVDSTCKSNNLSIAVIGAGISGLSFSKLFKSSFNTINQGTKKVNITIFEGRDRIGGRINTNTSFCSVPIELGAEEIHGGNCDMYKLIKKHKKVINLDKFKSYCEYNNKFDNWENFECKDEQFIFMDQFYDDISNRKIMSKIDPKISLLDYYKTLKKEHKITDNKVLHLLNGSIGVDYSTDLSKISAKKYSDFDWNWRSGEETFGILNGTYTDILNIEFSEEIKEVQFSNEIKTIEVLDNLCVINNQYKFDLVVCTVPVPLLKEIQFIPKLKDEKIKAIEKLVPDDCGKLILKFNEKFWNDDTGEIYLDGYFQILWPSYKLDKNGKIPIDENILICMVAGENCRYIEKLFNSNPKDIIDLVTKDLQRVYCNKNIKVIDYLWHNWMNEKFSRGAYTHPSIYEDDSRKIISEPHENRIFFIGDALAPYGHISTVHGSYECSKLLVDKLLKN